jgi:hypothetical protein
MFLVRPDTTAYNSPLSVYAKLRTKIEPANVWDYIFRARHRLLSSFAGSDSKSFSVKRGTHAVERDVEIALSKLGAPDFQLCRDETSVKR